MKFIEDGNLKEWVRVAMVIVGIVLVVSSVWNGLKSSGAIAIFFVGVVIAAIGGYAAQAHMLKIKPFGSGYEKAHESYKTKDDEQDQSK